MAEQIASTSSKVPIGAWMLQGDPTQPEMLAALAYANPGETWPWEVRPSDRTSQMAPGHPVLFWLAEGGGPGVASGIWLAGEVVEGATEGEPWDPGDGGPAVVPLYVTVRLDTLVSPIPAATFRNHATLHDLQILQAPGMPSPHVVTVDQLDALRADFDLTTGPLSDDLRAALVPDRPSLIVRGADGTTVEVYADDEGCSVWVAGEQVAAHPGWQEAFRDAVRRGGPVATADPGGDPETLAAITTDGGAIWIVQSGAEFLAFLHLDADDSAEPMDGSFPSLEDAVLQLAAGHMSDG